MPPLSRLAETVPGLSIPPEFAALEIAGVSGDSRQVLPGCLFVAMKEEYAAQAVQKGASVIVLPGADPASHSEPLVLHHPNPRLALAKLAAAFYPRPPGYMAAITGTDGKTSTAEFFRQLAEGLGHKAASIGTLGYMGEGRKMLREGTHTTPDPVALHQSLQSLAEEGYTHAALEASSHGLHQHRMDGVRLEAAAFTVFTRDHLDYHGTVEEYFAAKARLFSELLPPGGAAVLNADDARFPALQKMAAARGCRVISYGSAASDLRIAEAIPLPEGQHVRLNLFGRECEFETPLAGGFQVYNMLAALGLLAGMGENPEKLAALLPLLRPVPGRMECVLPGVYIDYAHTPAALEGALKTLRPHTKGKLIVVFGCGGDRDTGKRPEMGRAAAALADAAIVTDDNPRSEDPAAIRAQVLAGASGLREVAGRREAIYAGLRMLSPGDVLLVAGKGHEKTQTIAGEVFPFDDAEIIRELSRTL